MGGPARETAWQPSGSNESWQRGDSQILAGRFGCPLQHSHAKLRFWPLRQNGVWVLGNSCRSSFFQLTHFYSFSCTLLIWCRVENSNTFRQCLTFISRKALVQHWPISKSAAFSVVFVFIVFFFYAQQIDASSEAVHWWSRPGNSQFG